MTAHEIAFMRSIPPLWEAFLGGARTVERETTALAERPLDVELGARVDVPAQYLLGGLSESPVFLNGARELAEQMRAAVHLVPGQRHIAMAATPDVVAELITQLAHR
jgi:pimeloyl-ACP methyl ester carboxylesterase